MIHHILVAYDGFEPAEHAYDFGLDLASKHKAKLTVLSIARPPEPAVSVELMAVLESATEYYESRFKIMREKAESLGVQPRFEIKVGHPAEQIVHFAEEAGADTIVMGHRGENLLQRWLLGSVAKRVISYAHCTVVVVR